MSTAVQDRPTKTSSVIDTLVQNRTLVEYLPIDKVKPAKDNPRKNIRNVSEMASSIKSVGILEPLLVTKNGTGYTIVCGERRFRGAKEAGLKEVPALIRELTDKERREIMLIENVQREDLSPLEEAEAFAGLLELGYSQRELAARTGRSQPHISKRLQLRALPAKVKTQVDSGGIAIGDALELTKLVDMPKRLEMALRHRNEYGGISGQVERELRNHKAEVKKVTAEMKIKNAGVKLLIPWPSPSWYGRKERALKQSIDTYRIHHGDQVPLTVKQHQGESCHAATVDEQGQTYYLCTDPDRHRKKGGAGVKAPVDKKQQAARARRRQYLKEMRAAHDARRAFIDKLLGRKVTLGDVVELLVPAHLNPPASDYKRSEIACELLGVKPGKGYGDVHRSALARYLEKFPEETNRVGLALALADVEAQFAQEFGFDRDYGRRHLTFLEDKGYEISAAERLAMNGKAPR